MENSPSDKIDSPVNPEELANMENPTKIDEPINAANLFDPAQINFAASIPPVQPTIDLVDGIIGEHVSQDATDNISQHSAPQKLPVETDAELIARVVATGAPPKFKIDPADVVEEHLYTPYAYVAINKQTYGLSKNVNLLFDTAIDAPSTRFVLDSREKSFKAEIILRGSIQRDMSPQHNPQARKHFIFEIAVSARHIEDIELEPPGSFSVPDYFQAPQDWDPMKKGRLTFTTNKIRVLNISVPKLQDEIAEARLKTFFSNLLTYRQRGDLIHFDAIVSYLPFDGIQEDTLLNNFVSRVISDDHIDNPAYVWSLNSPHQHQLLQPNLHPPASRPSLAKKYLIREQRRTFDEPFDMKVPAVYSVHDEHLIAQAQAIDFLYHPPLVAFQPVAGSAIKTNDNDNDLPKIYLASVRWTDLDLARPRPGDRFRFNMPFPVPACPAPPPHAILKTTPAVNQELIQQHERVQAEDHGIYDKFTEHPKDKFDREEEQRQAYLETLRKTWIGEVIEPTPLNAPGDIMFKVFRPRDPTWRAVDSGPHVATVIPEAETRIRDIHKYHQYLQTKAVRHEIGVAPITSDQTYKDTMRTLNQFFDGYDSDLNTTVLRHHLVPLMTTGDTTLPFPTRDFFAACVDPERFTVGFTEYQRAQWQGMRYFDHGVKIVKGGPAAGKSAVLIAAALACAAKGNQTIIASDTNDLANDLTQRTGLMLRQTGNTDIEVVRVLPNHVEDAKFRSLHITPPDEPFFKAEGVSDWLIEKFIAEQGQKALNSKRRGDKRLRPEIADFSLHAAMNRQMIKDPEEWSNLIRLLEEAKTNPHDKTNGDVWKNIGKELDALRHHVLSHARIVIATVDLLLREPINKSLSPVLLLKDEDAASIRQKLMCLLAVFHTLQFVALFGDTKQKGPFLLTSKESSPATFAKFPAYTQMASFEDMGIVPVSLLEQHRMYNTEFVAWISRHYYNSALLDGNISKPQPPQVAFCQAFIKDYLSINNNYAFVVFRGSESTREEGTTSMVNPAMQQYFLDMLIALKRKLDTSQDLGFDPQTFQVGVVTSYLGVANWYQSEIATKLDRRFTAQVVQTVQGTQKNLIIRIIPNRKLSKFAGDGRDNLVADTRWKHGYIVGITEESLLPATYGSNDSGNFLFKSPATQHINSQCCFAQNVSSLVNITLDTNASKACRDCHKLGHVAGNEQCPAYQKGHACHNCGSFEHMFHDCPDPLIIDPPRPKNPCRRCGGDHHPRYCNLPWCKSCQTSTHAGEDCPNATCARCKQQGHRASSKLCPKKKICSKCGSSDHSASKCLVTPSHQYALARPEATDPNATNILDLELRAQKEAFPDEFVDQPDAQHNQPDEAEQPDEGEQPEKLDGWGMPINASKQSDQWGELNIPWGRLHPDNSNDTAHDEDQVVSTRVEDSSTNQPTRRQWFDNFHNLQSLTNTALETYHALSHSPFPGYDPYFFDEIRREFLKSPDSPPSLEDAQNNLQKIQHAIADIRNKSVENKGDTVDIQEDQWDVEDGQQTQAAESEW